MFDYHREMPHLGGIISHGKARSTAEQDQIVPIGSIGPIAYRLLDLKDIVRHDLDGGGFPLALRGEDGGEGIGRLVRSGVLRGRIGDDQNGYLEPSSGIVGLHHGETVGSGICERVERRRGGEVGGLFKGASTFGDSGVSRTLGT